ncbi:Put7p [Sporobolomyces koalae]|uniref:Put7p n=1 Tax=Sporobolomyces koalae TaxID=500713 RepID=UPI003173043B
MRSFITRTQWRPIFTSTRTASPSSAVPSAFTPTRATLAATQDSHGSKLTTPTPQTKLRPRDRLQFIEDASSSASSAVEGGDEPAVVPSSQSASSTNSHEQSTNEASPDSIVLDQSAPYTGLPPLHTHPFHLPRIPFSTHRFIRQLEQQEVKRDTAKVLSSLLKSLILNREERIRDDLLSKQDLENEAYLFSAALNELRTGSQVKSRADSITLKSLTASLQRESDGVEQKMKEDMQRLRSDIQLEMNARKEETGTELQGLEMKIMDLNSKFTILLGEVRTEIEATKWISTRRVMTAIVIVVVSVVAYFSSSSASKSKATKPDKPVPSIEELGVKPDPHEEAVDVATAGPHAPGTVGQGSQPGGWSFWGSSSPILTPSVPSPPAATSVAGKRLGEQEE